MDPLVVLNRLVDPQALVGRGRSGDVYLATRAYVNYLADNDDGLLDDTDCVVKIVEPSYIHTFSVTDIRNEIEFVNYLSSRPDTRNVVVPFLHWLLLYTSKETGNRVLMSSHLYNANTRIRNEWFHGDIFVTVGNTETMKAEICWTKQELEDDEEVKRRLTDAERATHTSLIRAMITMPRYEGDLLAFVNRHRLPLGGVQYRICAELIFLVHTLHGARVVHGDIHEKNILYAFTDDGLIFRLHDFGRASYWDEKKAKNDIARLGSICLRIMLWTQDHGLSLDPNFHLRGYEQMFDDYGMGDMYRLLLALKNGKPLNELLAYISEADGSFQQRMFKEALLPNNFVRFVA